MFDFQVLLFDQQVFSVPENIRAPVKLGNLGIQTNQCELNCSITSSGMKNIANNLTNELNSKSQSQTTTINHKFN